jgi:hypothetical protein
MLTAGVYVCAILVLLRTPARGVLWVVFTPLGPMSLTNYLAVTVWYAEPPGRRHRMRAVASLWEVCRCSMPGTRSRPNGVFEKP